jgi:hypothetical protein
MLTHSQIPSLELEEALLSSLLDGNLETYSLSTEYIKFKRLTNEPEVIAMSLSRPCNVTLQCIRQDVAM